MVTACPAASRASGRWTSTLWLITWRSGEIWPHVLGPVAHMHHGRCSIILTSCTAACVHTALPRRLKHFNSMV